MIPARMTHDYDGDLVVFLIGMRINKPWRPDLWLPVFFAMPAMLAELSKDKDSGLLGYRLTFGAGGPLLVQYWNSHEKLYQLCKRPECGPPSGLGRIQPAGRVKLQARSASGTRPISSSGPSRSTPACLFRGWPRPHPPCRWRGAARPRRSGSVRDKPPEADRYAPRQAQGQDSGEKWSGGGFAQR